MTKIKITKRGKLNCRYTHDILEEILLGKIKRFYARYPFTLEKYKVYKSRRFYEGVTIYKLRKGWWRFESEVKLVEIYHGRMDVYEEIPKKLFDIIKGHLQKHYENPEMVLHFEEKNEVKK